MNTTQAIIVNHIRYGENGLIIKALSEDVGLTSFFLNRFHSKGHNKYPFLFSPLSLVEIVSKTKSSASTMATVVNVELSYPYKRIPHDYMRSATCVFMAELLNKTMLFETSGNQIFQFVNACARSLDEYKTTPTCFPIYFGFKLASLLGFAPEITENADYFHMEKGIFTQNPIDEPYLLDKNLSRLLKDILNSDVESIVHLNSNPADRHELLDKMLIYYQLHIPESKEIMSAEIIREVFR